MCVLPLTLCWERSFKVPHTQNSIHGTKTGTYEAFTALGLGGRWSCLCKLCGEKPSLNSLNLNLVIPTHPQVMDYRESKTGMFSGV